MDNSLLSTLRKVKLTSHLKRCSDDDFIDRINNFYTPLILVVFTIVICTKSYIVGEPLQCWVPIQFSKGWEKYSESWCYVKNTYYIPSAHEVPNKQMRSEAELQYYQWVPFVLGLQAALFVFPAIFWKFSNWQARIHLKPLIQRGVKSSFESGEGRIKTLKGIANHLRNCLFNRPVRGDLVEPESFGGIFNSGVYLTLCYITMKILYVVNILIQFVIVHRFLKTNLFFGYNLVTKVANGSDWQETGLFPRVTLCDFTIPRIGQPLHTTMQCVLVINLFNEKIYIFLWFWLAFLFILTTCSLLAWIGRILFGRTLTTYISTKSEYVRKGDKIYARNVCESEMNCDSYFSLRMIETNCGMLTTRRIVEMLLDNYKAPESMGPEKYNSLPPNYNDLDRKDRNSETSSMKLNI